MFAMQPFLAVPQGPFLSLFGTAAMTVGVNYSVLAVSSAKSARKAEANFMFLATNSRKGSHKSFRTWSATGFSQTGLAAEAR